MGRDACPQHVPASPGARGKGWGRNWASGIGSAASFAEFLWVPQRRRTRLAFIVGLLLWARLAHAAGVETSLPLGAYQRVGRYVPAHVVARDAGAVSTEIAGTISATIAPAAKGPTDAVLPALVVKSDHPLDDETRLIGSTVPEMHIASLLFPEKKLLRVELDLANPLPGPPIAWNALDAVLLDATAAARITEKTLETLLASGTAVAVKAESRPVAAWDWKRLGAWWVARPPASSSTGSDELVQPERYADFMSAGVGWPAPVRWSLFFILLAFSLLVLALSILRWRMGWIAVTFLSVFTAFAVVMWRTAQRPMIQSFAITRVGPWQETVTHYAATADGPFRHSIGADDAFTMPVYWSKRQVQDVKLTLQCDADGTPRAFVGDLKRDQSIAFLTRSRAAGAAPAALPR